MLFGILYTEVKYFLPTKTDELNKWSLTVVMNQILIVAVKLTDLRTEEAKRAEPQQQPTLLYRNKNVIRQQAM